MVHSSGWRGTAAPGYMQGSSSRNTWRPDTRGGKGRGQTTLRFLAGMLMAVTKAQGEGDTDGLALGGRARGGSALVMADTELSSSCQRGTGTGF